VDPGNDPRCRAADRRAKRDHRYEAFSSHRLRVCNDIEFPALLQKCGI
jgi:hypothetical protein